MSELALKLIREAKEKRLTRLDLGNCGLTELPDELFELTWLEELNLESNKKLKNLDLLKKLTLLHSLFLHDTIVIDLNPLKKLKQLQYLDISKTQVSDLSPLKDLTKLQQFAVYKTQVTDLSPLKNLFQLQIIDVCYTQVSDLNPLKDLVQLEKLDINNTKVSDLRPLRKIIEKGVLVEWMKYGRGISVEGCPFKNPPIEIVKQGNDAILNYWKQISLLTIFDKFKKQGILTSKTKLLYDKDSIVDLTASMTLDDLDDFFKENSIDKESGYVELYEAKLIIVGEGNTGKTTLFEKLKDNNYKLQHIDETHGINIHEGLKFNHKHIGENVFNANLWDFGGQESNT